MLSEFCLLISCCCFLLFAAHRRHAADVRVEIVAAEIEREAGVIHAEFGRLGHHELVHRHVGARRLAAVAREEILPRLGVKIDAVKTKARDLGNAFARGFKIGIKRLEEIPEPPEK